MRTVVWTSVAFVLGGCTQELECGDGTEEEDGECVPEQPGNGGNNPFNPDPSNTPDTNTTVPTTGPVLTIEPAAIDLGTVEVPCIAETRVQLVNEGTAPLTIDSLDFDGFGVLSLRNDAAPNLPVTLSPATFLELTVSAAPLDDSVTTATLSVGSNDPRGARSAEATVDGAWASWQHEEFGGGLPQVDVLMLIDQSCSMEGNNAQNFDVGFPLFIEELDRVADWQMIEVIRADGCATGGILDPSVPNADQLLADNAFAGFQHALTERLLELASLALSKTGPGGCNAGFLRPGADLQIIVASDESEQSGTPWLTWLTDYLTYVDDDQDRLVVSGIIDLGACEYPYGGADGYTEAIAASGGASLEICSALWGLLMDDLVVSPSGGAEGQNSWTLSQPVWPGTLSVEVNGTPTADWTYEPADGVLTVHSPPVGAGDDVGVDYAVPSACGA